MPAVSLVSLETVVRCVNEVVTKHRLKPKWNGICQVIDALAAGPNHHVATELCRWMNANDRYTRSCFIRPFMQAYCASRLTDVEAEAQEDTTNDDTAGKRDAARRGRERAARPPKRTKRLR